MTTSLILNHLNLSKTADNFMAWSNFCLYSMKTTENIVHPFTNYRKRRPKMNRLRNAKLLLKPSNSCYLLHQYLVCQWPKTGSGWKLTLARQQQDELYFSFSKVSGYLLVISQRNYLRRREVMALQN